MVGEVVEHFLVEHVGMFFEDLGDFDGHGAVEEGDQVGDAVFDEQFVEVVENFLGAFHGKTRDNDIAAGSAGFVDDGGQAFFDVAVGFVEAVAVGGFDENVIGLLDEGRVVEDGHVPAADVAGEEQGAFFAVVVDVELDHGRAEDVAGVVINGIDAVVDGGGGFVLKGRKKRDGRFGVGDGVERFDGVFAFSLFAFMAFFLVLGVFFLDVGRIEHDDGGDFGSGAGGVDFAVEAFLDQFGQPAAMVEVSVGEQDGVDLARRDGELIPVAVLEGAFLEETAVDEEFEAVDLQEMAGTGDILGGAEEGDFDFHR